MPDAALGAIPLLDQPLSKSLAGVLRPALLSSLDRFALSTGKDLLSHYPRRYITWREPTPLSELILDEVATVEGTVTAVRATPMQRRIGNKPGARLAITLDNAEGRISLVYFGTTWYIDSLVAQVQRGNRVTAMGRVTSWQGQRQINSPTIHVHRTEDEDDEQEAQPQDLLRPRPIYPATATLDTFAIERAVTALFNRLEERGGPQWEGLIQDPLPESIRARHGFMGVVEAYRGIHQPADDEQWREARRRFQYEEAFIAQTGLALIRHRRSHGTGARAWARPTGSTSLRSRLDAALPFTLTDSQEEVGELIEAALDSTAPMNLLLQGDVGSGKTLVSLRAMLQVVDAGGQAALLAPTDVLATQHAATIRSLLADSGVDVPVWLLRGATPAAQRRGILAEMAAGSPGIAVGTHALLSEGVHMRGLGLVVVDEQHRFGVAQRHELRAREGYVDPVTGERHPPHMLVMTATPIPRTIAMTAFGDLDLAVMSGRPSGRKDVHTAIVPWGRPAWVQRMWQKIAEDVAADGRVFVVCPAIGDDEGSGPASERARVSEWVERLAALPKLAGIRIGTLTGRMSATEKNQAMEDFTHGATPILVCTTVIEVGVDVSAASLMIILDADNFGLSQLHQLRGRVGRGNQEAWCLAVTGAEADSLADKRLQAFASTNDGFALADMDLSLRKEGDVLGAEQSGRRSHFDLLSVSRDRHIIEQARDDASALIDADPDLHDHPSTLEAVRARLDDTTLAFLDSA